jgi:hypothetical protein
MAVPEYEAEFTSELMRIPGDGGWTFAPVPPNHAPSVTFGWGRTPVRATVDDKSWSTSVWREKTGRTLLPVPKKIRGTKDHGDIVHIRIAYSVEFRD